MESCEGINQQQQHLGFCIPEKYIPGYCSMIVIRDANRAV